MSQPESSSLSATGEKQLRSYVRAAVAGVGALSAAQVAHADVMSYSYPNEVLDPAVNQQASFTLFPGGPTLTLFNSGNSYFYVGATNNNGLGLVGGGNQYAANLAAGAAISAAQTFLTPNAARIGYHSTRGVNSGNFIGQIGYLGFEFTDPTINTQTDYGWVRIGDNTAQSQLTILSAAYDDSGAAINAGLVPEPGSLGLLAGGAGCLATWRLRRGKRRQMTADATDASLAS